MARDLDEVDRVDDADAAAGHAAVDRLRVPEMRVHARPLVDEPRAQVA
jgi:hypothetical protein